MTAFSLSGHVDSPDCPCGPWVNRWGVVLAHLDERVPMGKGLLVAIPDPCLCGDASCAHFQAGYPFCRPCDEHHRGPECAIDADGNALASDGIPWKDHP